MNPKFEEIKSSVVPNLSHSNVVQAYKLRETMATALYTYREQRESFLGIQRRGMAQDLSWDKAAQQYEDVLIEAKYQW